MCIEKVDAWKHGDALFTSEADAVVAALKDLAQNLMRDHSSDMFTGLVATSEKLMPLLQRHAELNPTLIPVVTYADATR